MWKRLDPLAATGLPIHLTEISAKTPDESQRAEALEALFRVGFAHSGVQGILIWGFWEKSHWMGRNAVLVDADWNLLPAGKRIFEDLLGREWNTDLEVRSDQDGKVVFRGFFVIVIAGSKSLGTVSFQSKGSRGAVLEAR